jgi:hypothetical protein
MSYACISIEILPDPVDGWRLDSSARGEVDAEGVQQAAEFFIQDSLMGRRIEPGQTFIGVSDGATLWLCGILDGYSAWVTCTEPLRSDLAAPEDLWDARADLFAMALRTRE